ncbi:branched-chain amino acid ABC transporter permease [Agromyces bauzanensis]
MGLLLQTLVFGILLGGLYALAASGLALTFGVMRLVNLAHGALLVLGGYVTYTIWTAFGIDPLLSIVLTAPVLAAAGWLLYSGLIKPALPGGEGGVMILTFALLLVFDGVFGLVWGHEAVSVDPSYVTGSFIVGDIVIPQALLYGCGVAVIVLGALAFFLSRTWQGRAIRAAASNEEGAKLVGVRVRGVSALTFALGAAMAGAGGALIILVYPISPDSGTAWLARGLAIVALGGLGSLGGTVVAAVLFAMLETFTAAYISLNWTAAVPFLIILAVFLLRPQGLFGARGRSDLAVHA